MITRHTFKSLLCLALAGLSLVLALSLLLERQQLHQHQTMVDNLSATVLGSIQKTGDMIAGFAPDSPQAMDQLSLLSYQLQLAEDNLDVLRADPRFPSEVLQGLTEQLSTARVEVQAGLIKHDTAVAHFATRLEALAGQFPKTVSDHPTDQLITTLKGLHL